MGEEQWTAQGQRAGLRQAEGQVWLYLFIWDAQLVA